LTTAEGGRRNGSGLSITLPLAYEWVLLLDADEVMTPALEAEIADAIASPTYAGYRIALQMHFLGRQLQHQRC